LERGMTVRRREGWEGCPESENNFARAVGTIKQGNETGRKEIKNCTCSCIFLLVVN